MLYVSGIAMQVDIHSNNMKIFTLAKWSLHLLAPVTDDH